MARSQSDGERHNERAAPDGEERASLLEFLAPSARVDRPSLQSFLTPAPSSRRSDVPVAPKSSVPTPIIEPEEGSTSKGFWDPPLPRRSSAPPVEVPVKAAVVESEELPLVLAPRGSEKPVEVSKTIASAVSELPTSVEEESAEQLSTRDFISTRVLPGTPSPEPPAQAGTRPSTLAPAAYDTTLEDRNDSERDDIASVLPPPAPRILGPLVGIAIAAAMVLGLAALAGRRRSTQAAAAPEAPAEAAVAAQTAAPEAPMELGAIVETAAPAAPIDEAMGRQLQQRARELLVSGQIVEGVLFARRAIAANPLDGDNYVLLAAGLEDLGRWEEARNIFNQCVRRSGGPASSECRYFATLGN